MTDSVVEGRHKGVVNIVRVFLLPGTYEVEVADNDPRAIDMSGKIKQFLKEGIGMSVVRWTIDVGDMNCEVR